jgi:Tfp pilus assembly protein PilF
MKRILALLASGIQAQTSPTASATSDVERGNDWLAKGEVARAIADYDLALSFDPRLAQAYYHRGFARQHKIVGRLTCCKAMRQKHNKIASSVSRSPRISSPKLSDSVNRSSSSSGLLA